MRYARPKHAGFCMGESSARWTKAMLESKQFGVIADHREQVHNPR
jgi:hypothetical protein